MTKEYSLDGYLGKIWTRKSPYSGSNISVYHSEQAGMDHSEGVKYHAVCEDHGMLMGETTIARAKSAALDSPSWCDECAKEDKKRHPNLGRQFQ